MKPLFVETDPKFHELIDTEAVLEPVSVGHRVTEGIIWWPQNNCLIFSDMAAGKVFKWDPETFETTVIKFPSNISNGNFIDTEGLPSVLVMPSPFWKKRRNIRETATPFIM